MYRERSTLRDCFRVSGKTEERSEADRTQTDLALSMADACGYRYSRMALRYWMARPSRLSLAFQLVDRHLAHGLQ